MPDQPAMLPVPEITYALTLTSENLPGKSELMEQVLGGCGIAPERIGESVVANQLALTVYFNEEPEAKALEARLADLALNDVQVTVLAVSTPQWRDAWKTDIAPFELTPTIDVVPVWNQSRYVQSDRRIIFLDTTLAFGTGLHETTRFMANAIEQIAGQFESFLDIGTGTGLLALVARQHAAQPIWAMDYDPESIRVAQENFVANKVQDIHLQQGDIKTWNPGRIFDCVTANLTSNDLLENAATILRCVAPRGWLAISGISVERFAEVDTHFQGLGLTSQRVYQGESWRGALYRCPDSKDVL